MHSRTRDVYDLQTETEAPTTFETIVIVCPTVSKRLFILAAKNEDVKIDINYL